MSSNLLISTLVCLAVTLTAVQAQRPKLYEEREINSHVDYNDLTKQGVSYRLPNDTFPVRYDISLNTRIDLGVFEFTGNVIIHLQAKEITSLITLHSKMLTIDSITLTDGVTAQEIQITGRELDEALEFLKISTAVPLTVGKVYVLEINYNGTLRIDNGGFYRSSYVNEQGVETWLATTQFERTEARHAFPSYDEPGIRAVYGVRITHSRTYHAVSNMPMKEQIPVDADTITTVFDDSPVMQTYLNAFVVSNFKIISNAAGKPDTELLQQVVGRPAYLDNGEADFALEAGIKILKGMEAHFNFKYPLPKMDQAGIPDFGGGAMENWGLVTYRENALYYNPQSSPLSQKEYVASIVAHEFAHQWFGNIISPTWWEFIWLNEGFATLYEYFAADLAYPEFRYNHLMVVSTLQSVFERDAYETTRAMNTYNESPAELRMLFDFVAYDKSGCVLRMMQHVLTDATFTKGLTYYFNDMQYKAANPNDLYRNWERAAREDNAIPASAQMAAIMDSWAYQKGYPAITVTRNDAGTVTVTQERFLLEKLPTTQPLSWWIPYNFVVEKTPDFSKTTPDGWIPQGTASITIEPTAAQNWTNDEWILFNKQQTGYYRVNYDAKLWELLATELLEGDFNKIHVLNRAQLIDDAYTFARVDQAKYSTAFMLMEYLSKEMDYVPWVAANRALTALDRLMASSDKYDHFKTFVHHMVQPIFEKLGVRNINNEPYFDRLARNVAIKWACYVGSEECLEATNGRVKEFISTNVAFEADLRSTVMCNGLRQANEMDFLAVWTKMQASNVAVDRNLMITALGCSQNADLLKVLLATTIVDADVNYSTTERANILSAVIQGGIVGVEAVIGFLDVNFEAASTRFGLATSVNNIAAWISNQAHLTLYTALVDKLTAGGQITAAVASSAKLTAQNNVQWQNKYSSDITDYLDGYIERSGSTSLIISSAMILVSIMLSVLNFF